MDDVSLRDFEGKLERFFLRGQWQTDANRPQEISHVAGALRIEPKPGGATHVWKWSQIDPLLVEACSALEDSLAARRALILSNPKLLRGTTHTLLASIQVVRPGEIAWAHRHVINALRFAINCKPGAFTVVEGRELAMQPFDLILTPGWTWHDHHNESDANAIWLDALDVPFTLALNQQFYEEPGHMSQPRSGGDLEPSKFKVHSADQNKANQKHRPYRYPWNQMKKVLERSEINDPALGICVEYINPLTGGSVLPTISCRAQVLPPGFEGVVKRTTASEIAFVIEGNGSVDTGECSVEWEENDTIALPNWSKRRWMNHSKNDRAILFILDDTPMLTAFGFLRDKITTF